MYTRTLSIPGISFKVIFDWDVSPGGKQYLALTSIEHPLTGEEGLEVLPKRAIIRVTEMLQDLMKLSPPSPEEKAQVDAEMRSKREEHPAYKLLMADASAEEIQAAVEQELAAQADNCNCAVCQLRRLIEGALQQTDPAGKIRAEIDRMASLDLDSPPSTKLY